MKLKLENIVFKIISEIATENDEQVFVIGGFVRDMIMGRPSSDIDIVIEGSGIELAEKTAKKLGIKKITTYKNFGTAMFVYNNFKFEFVGARKESYRADSRNPIVENGSILDDISRRDFTINTIAASLRKDYFGEILDLYKGIDDINNKIIRTPLEPDITFSDDPLRMIRAIRFATQLDFRIEESAFKSIKSNKHRIKILKQERITEELNKLMLANKPSKGFKLLKETGILDLIIPRLSKLSGTEIIGEYGHKDVFYHSLQVLDNLSPKSDNLWLRWAALLHDIGKPEVKKFDPKIGWTFHNHDYIGSQMIKKIFAELKLPLNENMEYVKKLVSLHLRPIALVDEEVSDSAIRRLLFDAGNAIDDLMTLCEADITSKNDSKVMLYLANFAKVRIKLKEVEEKDKLRNWQPPVTGEIIMETFGLQPSVEVGIIKDAIREAILNCEINNNYEEAFKFMINFAKKLNLKKTNKNL